MHSNVKKTFAPFSYTMNALDESLSISAAEFPTDTSQVDFASTYWLTHEAKEGSAQRIDQIM